MNQQSEQNIEDVLIKRLHITPPKSNGIEQA
jgi:hypothetical protein